MKLKLWAGAIMLALSLLVQPLLAGQAEDAIGRGDYTTALKLISPLAEQGDAHAQLVTLFPTEERELGFRFPMGAPPPDLQPKNDSTLVGAAFRQYNTVTSAYNYISSRFGLTDEPGHNPLDVIRGTKYEQNYLMRFVDSFSLAETKMRMGQIDQEIRDKQRIHSAGLGGTVMSIVAGVLDPLIAFPIMALWFLLRKLRKRNAAALTSWPISSIAAWDLGVGVDAIKGGYAALRAGSSVAAMSAFQSGIQESILYGTQQIKMYANGLGVPQDYVLSHMWLNLAAASGETDGTKLREICERLMTPDQIAEAQRLAREWVAAHPKR